MVSVAVFCAHRDKNAAINLALVPLSRVRMANPEFTPDDALLSRLPRKKQEVIAWNKILTWLCFQLVYVLCSFTINFGISFIRALDVCLIHFVSILCSSLKRPKIPNAARPAA